jgi:hypothetical protein
MAHATPVYTDQSNPPSDNPAYKDEGQTYVPFATAEFEIPVAGQPSVVDQMMNDLKSPNTWLHAPTMFYVFASIGYRGARRQAIIILAFQGLLHFQFA